MRRRSARGADGITWAAWRRDMGERIPALATALREGAWHPEPVRVVQVTNYAGKTHPIYIPTTTDRIVHRAMRAAIEPVLEAQAFRDWVSGYRPGRSRITAVAAAAAHLAAGRTAVADIDVRAASAGTTPDEVTDWLAVYVSDGTFLDRVRTALTGLPEPLVPGSGLWPVLFNLRLSRVDALLDGLPVVRFADNYCAFARYAADAESAFAAVTGALAAGGLLPHPGKSQIRPWANAEDLFLIAG